MKPIRRRVATYVRVAVTDLFVVGLAKQHTHGTQRENFLLRLERARALRHEVQVFALQHLRHALGTKGRRECVYVRGRVA